jgi:hypothetical protein
MLTYREPDGTDVTEPSEAFLRERVLDADLTYWSGPAGDGFLVRQGEGEDRDLVLIVSDAGALVQYHDYLDRQDLVAADPPGDVDDWVEVYDGQELMRVRRRFLVSREAAWTAVSEFSRSGRAAPSLRWETELEVADED